MWLLQQDGYHSSNSYKKLPQSPKMPPSPVLVYIKISLKEIGCLKRRIASHSICWVRRNTLLCISFYFSLSLCVSSHISWLSLDSPFLFTILSRPFWHNDLIPLRVQLLLDICYFLSSGVSSFSGIIVFLKIGNRLSQLSFPGLKVF